MIIGTVIAAGTALFSASLKQQQFKETQTKLAAIQKALLDFRRAYDRLPCPADVLTGMVGTTYAATDAAAGALFGAQARLWHNTASPTLTCTNYDTGAGTASAENYIPSANFIDDANNGIGQGYWGSGSWPYTTTVMGMVPVRTLGLPDDYAIDGWGRRIMYAVDFTATSPPFTTNISLPDTGGPSGWRIFILDYNDNYKTTLALYALISYGPNGHGGFPRATDRSFIFSGGGAPTVSSGLTNDHEILNCNCDPANAYAAGYPTDSAVMFTTFPSGYDGGLIGTFDYINNATYSGYYPAPVFYQAQAQRTYNSPTNDFDDMVVYATRADLLGYGE